ncbi:MAG: Phenylalanine--tRNA ligase beta subunit [Planctomycetes bacterium]|nr:Phenylalanine--tRNA ligase beta subunit [Planctomycetota bacterium]
MRASISWLRRHAELPADPRELADRLTMAGYVVAAVEPCGADTVLDVEVTYNRPDLLSHLGIARELASIFGTALREEPSDLSGVRACADHVPVRVEAEDLCPLYTARVVRGVRVGPSPAWLVAHLEACGQRSVNNVVDVTNWVMLSTGQPLHAFDLSKLAGPGIVVRRAKGEPFTAIDGRRLDVGADDLAICDAERPAALAGVMGGRESEVSDATTDILLESAVFRPLAIRATSRRHQLRSESSFRFERFVDPARTVRASDLAARMFADICGAAAVGPVVSAGPLASAPSAPARIAIRTARVAHVLGMPVTEERIASILASLGLRRESGSGGVSEWTAPTWRPDLAEEIDLIEEVGRMIGFDAIPAERSLPTRPLVADPRLRGLAAVNAALVGAGLRECVNAPFVGAGPLDVALLVDAPALRVENPMRSEESLLRRSLVGPLLATARRNAERGNESVRLFEAAPVYLGVGGGTLEMRLASGVVSGSYGDAKACVEAVASALGFASDLTWERGAPRPLRAARSATVRFGGEVVGVLGELGRAAVAAHGLAGPTAVFELRADRLADLARLDRTCEPVSRFPAVERDLAWIVDDAVTWARIEGAVRRGGGDLVRGVRWLNEYRGEQTGAGRKSVALRIEMRAPDRTLTGPEADACIASVLGVLGRETGGRIRA